MSVTSKASFFATSPQFAELIGMEQFHLVGQSLSSLCLNAESDRVSTFIQQCVRGDQLATATTIETILCGKPDGECLRLSLFVGAEVMRRVTMTRPTLTLRLQCAAEVIASQCRVAVEVSLLMVHTNSLSDSMKPMRGRHTINCCQYQEDVGCVCVLNG